MSDENNFMPFDGELFYVVEGTIIEVHTASSSINLLSELRGECGEGVRIRKPCRVALARKIMPGSE